MRPLTEGLVYCVSQGKPLDQIYEYMAIYHQASKDRIDVLLRAKGLTIPYEKDAR